MTTNETQHTILTPDYAALRARFGAEAKFQVDTILADLLPEDLIEIEYIKRIQAASAPRLPVGPRAAQDLPPGGRLQRGRIGMPRTGGRG